jgi:hypothetical protein
MATVARFALAGAALGAALPRALANSVHVAEKCQGGFCTNPKFPILDFDKEQGTCICRAHPCWNNDGVEHKCEDPSFPHLRFHVNTSGGLQCGCGKTAAMDSLHVARDLCAGEQCDSDEFPVMDWDEEGGKCICRANPCSAGVNGVKHACEATGAFPLLLYSVGSGGAPKCECHTKLEKPMGNLRGARSQDEPREQACSWAGSGWGSLY